MDEEGPKEQSIKKKKKVCRKQIEDDAAVPYFVGEQWREHKIIAGALDICGIETTCHRTLLQIAV